MASRGSVEVQVDVVGALALELALGVAHQRAGSRFPNGIFDVSGCRRQLPGPGRPRSSSNEPGEKNTNNLYSQRSQKNRFALRAK